ncbi:SDR family NAD(P)-dependent oxidoreductase [Sphingomonas jatrophae]|uniref:NAD(P)-dependent dehydrogenase, short-chain alcohol dehydrogenase family n=1 Tax=Sphingomonas jatrophae TaxID=1166337 RepID=A0A1I6KL09_9SPHN|nr:SDR family NAD(P)-dependent oxidoreductase [Sphingomonas jatrophae]SFR91728.1 NAD(P)-dependent dehydrogenase, short-chain alcohol dehydrogenase family [Sphingomonas jatrophae]
MSSSNETGRKVAIVTGASRGAGKGIAAALGAAGWRVYVTGRTLREGDAALPGTIGAAAQAVTDAGGEGIAVQVDHADAGAIARLFEQVQRESGRLDILVNNVAAIHDDLVAPGPFWAKSPDLVDILDVGLRSHYLASYHAAPIMVAQGRGLIAFTSSFGSVCYMHGPAYGAQKAGVDKFAADMGVDFRDEKTGVAAVSLWMGPLRTERSERTLAGHPDQYEGFMAQAETPEFNGRLILAMYDDPKLAELNGQTVIGAEIAERYGVTEEGGRKPPSYRDMLGEPRVPHPAIVR